MARKRLTQLFPFLLPLRQWQRKKCCYLKMRLDKNHYADTISDELLPNKIFETSALMVNQSSGYDIQYQYNKVHNLKLAGKAINKVLIRDVPQGDFVGYDRAYQTERDSKIAILPIGYGDGFPRNLSCGKASVKIGTYIVPIIGRICMDQLAIDITDTEGVAVGDTATLIDNQENSLLSTPCVAERSDSISNEILSRMGVRLPIVIKE